MSVGCSGTRTGLLTRGRGCAVGVGSLLGSLAVSGALSLHAINADNINGKMAYFALVLNFFIKVSYN
ncbi:hypothetical protein [Moraxella lacunata]|uniref:Uncharacterized protein n=1 Tax=Moraxella lacunata TaxID=477 RepID=A0A1V4GZJ4_MORLA|nr:hypothetical protein [Moraxella lacunata]OPH38089.1 hypothetical protein B5J94_04485 [Moraxella lacunata]